jgi:hypothetical protein
MAGPLGSCPTNIDGDTNIFTWNQLSDCWFEGGGGGCAGLLVGKIPNCTAGGNAFFLQNGGGTTACSVGNTNASCFPDRKVCGDGDFLDGSNNGFATTAPSNGCAVCDFSNGIVYLCAVAG